MKKMIKAIVFLSACGFAPYEAYAGSRYATPPPLVLSPDISGNLTLQLKPLRRTATRRSLERAQRPARLKRRKKGLYTRIKPYKRTKRAAREYSTSVLRSGVARSGDVKLRRTITQSFPAELMPVVVNYNGPEKPGTLIVNTIERRLYLVKPGGKARRYAVGVGKPGFEWAGSHKVTRKAEWPDWRPPAEMIARERAKGRILPPFVAGGVKNPLGARALYLGSTIYRIHGTNQDWSIGKAVSSGCIRMRNQDVMDLYDRVPVGARVKVI